MNLSRPGNFFYDVLSGYIMLMKHKLAQIGMGGLNQQMKMIGHQNVGNKFDTESFTAIGQGINKSTAISFSDKDILATVAPVHHMVIGARILDSQRSCLTPLFTHFIKLVNFEDPLSSLFSFF